MSLQEGHIFADYEIIAKLGRGGMGAVYQARQVVLKRMVALKVLAPALAADEAFIQRFQAEAAAAANLTHPNIVQVYTAGASEGIHYIAMEYVEGPTLRVRLASGPLDWDQALDICYHVALALDYGWNKANLVHRDIKPDNIFIAKNGVIKLGDFGLAKSLDSDVNLTSTGVAMGSPHYISPEQARGERDIDFRTDIYSLGCTLYEVLTGCRVYEGESALQAILKHLNDPPPSLLEACPECPPILAALVNRMLAKAREDRHQSYDELIAEILAIRQQLEQGITGVSEPVPAATTPAGKARNRWLVLVAVLLLIAGLGMGAWWGYRSGRISATWNQSPDDPRTVEQFISSTERLSPDKQVEQVMAKLRELNPGFDGKEKYSVEDDRVTELSFSAIKVRKIWPVAALRDLQKLHCSGDAEGRRASPLSDLAALSDLSLQELNCSWTAVQSLQPLRDMALQVLRCANTRVNDLSPLKGMSLAELDCSHTPVRDLGPLKGMPLLALDLTGSAVRTLEPLRDMPLKDLKADLKLPRDADVLRSLKHLESINGKPIADFRGWKRSDTPRP